MSYVLAMYDIRGKQEFIFRTNKLKEIAGGSMVIRDCYNDYLFPAASKVREDSKGIFTYKDAQGKTKPNCDFSEEGFREHLRQGYIGEVVYDGGGNFILLYESQEIFQEVTFLFTKDVMDKIGTLRILATSVPIVDFSDYKRDRKRLYDAHRRNEANESSIAPWVSLPISQVDRKTSMPLTRMWRSGKPKKVSKEAYAKLDKFQSEYKKLTNPDKYQNRDTDNERLYVENVKRFDDMVSKKGVDSKLAVIYIDGNNMGAAVQKALESEKTYAECLKKLREFSTSIQDKYVEKGVGAVVESLSGKKYRIVVAAGDEINFVVQAQDALKCVNAYMKRLYSPEQHDSACAGIAVFHSHAPYADAYAIAEQCCESAKRCMKDDGMTDACLVDFHICQGAIGISLESIREIEGAEKISRPWLLEGETDNLRITRYQDVQEMVKVYNQIGRSNVKGLTEAARKDIVTLGLELRRIRAHLNDGKDTDNSANSTETKKSEENDKRMLVNRLDELFENIEQKRYLIYDVSLSYDLWFSDLKREENG